MKQMVLAVIAAAGLVVSLGPARADWSCSSLNPPGFWWSCARAISGGQVGGFAVSYDQHKYPGYWTTGGGPGSFVDLYDIVFGEVLAISGGRQGGYIHDYGAYWQGTKESVKFMPYEPDVSVSHIFGLSNEWAAGHIISASDITSHARLWDLSDNSIIDLSPQDSQNSAVWGIYGASGAARGVQAGRVDVGAALWRGTAASYVNLHPEDLASESGCWAAFENQQGGWARMDSDGLWHAALWSGTTGSFVDMQPPIGGLYGSLITGMSAGVQVGLIQLSDDINDTHAFLWYGSANNYVDLNQLLPSPYQLSKAWGVENTGNDIWVVGAAFNADSERDEAMLWHYTRPARAFIASGDYDGNGTSEVALFRPSSGLWAIRGLTRAYLGSTGDYPVSGDYDGNGTTAAAVFRRSSGLWMVRGVTRCYLGGSDDAPVPGDYNADGRCEIAVFNQPSGRWTIQGITTLYFGLIGDQPLPGDWNGDGSADLTVFRSSTGLWSIRNLTRFYFGSSFDTPAPGNYAGTPSRAAAVFRPSTGLWSVRGLTRFYLGGGADQAVPADYTGGAVARAGIFRSSTGLWSVRNVTRVYFGMTGDIPVAR